MVKEKIPQKIQGLLEAKKKYWPASGGVPPFLWFTEEVNKEEVRQYLSSHGGRLFARPAPKVPRHGFLESVPVTTVEEVVAIFRQVKRVDPGGGLVLMPYINAHANAIITPSGVTLGPGRDGATAGKGAYFLPAPSDPSALLQGIQLEGVPYLEVVHSLSSGLIVQLRSGPELPTEGDYIPEKVRVRKVIRITGEEDLLEWEERCRFLRGQKGVVVYHPRGSISSHFGVHCVINRIPYVTDTEPRPGQVLSPTAYRWKRGDIRTVAERIPRNPLFEFGEGSSLPLALAVVHSLGSFLSSKPTEAAYRLIGWAFSALVKASAIASVGELRYLPEEWRWKVPWGFLWRDGGWGKEPEDRDCVYEEVMGWTLEECGEGLAIAYHLFLNAPWSKGYGGRAWAKATKTALDLYNALADFTRKPTEAKLRRLGTLANLLTHATHNNGPYLEKLGDYDLVDLASRAPGYLIGVRTESSWVVFKEDQFLSLGELPRVSPLKPLRAVNIKNAKQVRRALKKVKSQLVRIGPPPELENHPGRVTLDFNDTVHIQVRMQQVNRSYGLAADLPAQSPIALLLADYWHSQLSRGEPPLRSLNSADPDELRYFPLRVWVSGNRILGVKVEESWYRV